MSNHEEDKLFKYATKEDGFSFINLIEEINWDIRKYDFKSKNLTFNPTELIELDPAIYKSDMIMELDSIIVMTEFQSTVVKKFDVIKEVFSTIKFQHSICVIWIFLRFYLFMA